MSFRILICLLSGMLLFFASCQKDNEMSKIPSISLTYFGPEKIKVNKQAATLVFGFSDGDADLGNEGSGTGRFDIYIKDHRYDSSGFVGYYFPSIDNPEILDPKKGISGSCQFDFIPAILSPRSDSLHVALGDTTHFEVYIMDKAGNVSNVIVTPDVIMVPK